MHATIIKHRCPHCDTMLHTVEKMAGRSSVCPTCDGTLTVPDARDLLPSRQPVVVPEVIPEDNDGELDVPRRKRHHDDDKPVKLRLNRDGAEMDVEVDRPTRNAMASTFVGAICAVLGAMVVAIFFGGKSKSS